MEIGVDLVAETLSMTIIYSDLQNNSSNRVYIRIIRTKSVSEFKVFCQHRLEEASLVRSVPYYRNFYKSCNFNTGCNNSSP